jgi:hypothetical protein
MRADAFNLAARDEKAKKELRGIRSADRTDFTNRNVVATADAGLLVTDPNGPIAPSGALSATPRAQVDLAKCCPAHSEMGANKAD